MASPTRFIDNRNYYKANYEKAIENIVPKVYYNEDYNLSGRSLDPVDALINSQLYIISAISQVLNVSAIPGTIYSAINTASGIAQFFIKQNNLTDIDANDFERKILLPLNKSFRDFETSSDFEDYLQDTLLPGIRLNSPSLILTGTASTTHNYLITNLSWLYFLNLSGPSGLAYQPSAYVLDQLTSKIYRGSKVELADGIKGLTTHIWNNYTTCTVFQGGMIPSDFRPPAYTLSDSYTSGTQQLDKLLTLVDIVYSPLYIDRGDVRVRDAIDDYLQNGFTLSNKVINGPFAKLIRAFSYSFADIVDTTDKLGVLNDLQECPDELLPYLAELIGWTLFGSEPDRWRLQLANAVSVYKRAGTKKSLQFAVDAVFAQDVFDVSSGIYELWESYVPNLIYYSLATESTFFPDMPTARENFISISRERPGLVFKFNETNMDENIRFCVDTIIHELIAEFPENFRLGGKRFPVDDPNFVFNYRNRATETPPFEEYPYYTDTIITDDMIGMIEDKLVCFGVPQSFAEEVAYFLRTNTVLADDDLRLDNNWLLFTSGAEYPPNWDSIILDVGNKRSQYLPLWNGKSSHFKLLFEAADFDFAKTSLEVDSSEAIKIASQIANDFSPAHAIPDIGVSTSATEYYILSSVILPYVGLDKTDYPQIGYQSSSILAGYMASAYAMSTYKRGIASGNEVVSRASFNSLDDKWFVSGATGTLPRRNHRRRDLKNLLPIEGFYSKNGFNMPVTMDMSATETSMTSSLGFLPLGLIPSAQYYIPISDHINLPSVWQICENRNSSSVYSGLIVSNTFPCRGWRRIESNAKNTSEGTRPDYFVDLGQLDPFIATLHYIKEQAKIYDASTIVYNDYNTYKDDFYWKNILVSYANSATAYSGAFPAAHTDYHKVQLGREMHKLYKVYTEYFLRHRLHPKVTELFGPTIFAHAYGSILKNSDFALTGPYGITSALNSTVELTNGTGLFSASGTASGTYVASSVSDVYVDKFEFRNSGVLNSVELIQTSASNPGNSFTVFKLSNTANRNLNRINAFPFENTIIRQKALNGFPRIQFNLKKYSNFTTDEYDVSTNFLLPEHQFQFSLKALISNNTGSQLGNGSIGVWIHTGYEQGKIWSYTPDKVWVQHDPSSITSDYVINNLAFKQYLPRTTRDLNQLSSAPGSRFRCLRFIDQSNTNRNNEILSVFGKDDFTDITVDFDTINNTILLPNTYFESYGQLHRTGQNYIIEVFTLPEQNNEDKFTLFYSGNLIDSTLSKWSKPLVGGIPNGSTMGDIYCKEFRVDLSKMQLLSILRYFNGIAGAYSRFGYASRVASSTSSVYETSGGSRINYRNYPGWDAENTLAASFNILTTFTVFN